MNIKHPELMFLLLLIPACIAFLHWAWRRRKRTLAQFCSETKLKDIFPLNSRERSITRYVLLIIAFSLCVISLISPRWGYDWKEVETKGTNIFLALDISRSMLAEDLPPNRLIQAKQEINKFIDKLTGDRVGLILFAGDAFMQVPLTHDYLMLKEWVSKIGVDEISSQGTSVKLAIEQAMKGFKHIESESKVLIIISDGEEQDEETLVTARQAKQEGIQIFTIGIGTNKGSPIHTADGLLRDENANIVISKLNDDLLKDIAKETDGYYVRSSAGDFHLENLYYDHIKKQTKSEDLKSGKTKLWYETYQLFMSIALVLLILELFLSLDLGLSRIFKWRSRK